MFVLVKLVIVVLNFRDKSERKDRNKWHAQQLEVLDPDVLLCNDVAMIREKLNVACQLGMYFL